MATSDATMTYTGTVEDFSDSMIECMTFALVVHYDLEWDIDEVSPDFSDADIWQWAMELADRYEAKGV